MICTKKVEESDRERAVMKQRAFFEVAKPVIKWMAENVHPHHKAVIDCNSAELLEGVCGDQTDEFLKD